MALPPVIAVTLGAVAGVAVARFVVREWRRVNAALHPHANVPVTEPATRERLPSLKADPRTGIYRPERQR